MRAFVTGGTGLVGRHIVDSLLQTGWEVAVLTRDPSRARDLAAVDIVVDASKARRELGCSPRPLEERVRETMAWYLKVYQNRGSPLPVKLGSGGT